MKGQAILPDAVPAGAHLLRVRIEDVSRADAAAATAGEVEIALAGPLPPGATIPFEVPVGTVDPKARYSVRVHLDCHGTGEIESGDLISTQSYPVLTLGAPATVEVRLQRA
ncbi:MAG TPA: YbaY family lipoprotein [Allosphingosinicella sp.]|nr:YbaY family lipoprotein [Allosphingosinicella sp.]